MTAAFGEAMGVGMGEGVTGGWGEAQLVSEEEGDVPPVHADMGNGHRLVINPEQWRALLHSQEVVDAITQRAQDICDAANSMVSSREFLEGAGRSASNNSKAEYDIMVQNRSDSSRARARVKPANFAAMLDDEKNATLQKAMMMYPSDPIPANIGPNDESVQPPDEGTGSEAAGEEGEAAAGGEVAGGEIAEAAVVAL